MAGIPRATRLETLEQIEPVPRRNSILALLVGLAPSVVDVERRESAIAKADVRQPSLALERYD